MQYKEFIFESYLYDRVVSTLSLRYRFGGGPRFEEKLFFDFLPRHLSPEAAMAGSIALRVRSPPRTTTPAP